MPTPSKGPRKAGAASGAQPLSVEFDLDSVTMAELEELESLIGGDVMEAMGEGKPKMRLLRALAFITMRRSNPDLTWDDIGALKITDLDFGTPPSPQ
jgi:hypothetical protein